MALTDPVPHRPAGWSDHHVRRWLERRIEGPGRAKPAGSGRLSSGTRAGDEGPIHSHTREDETVCVLEGAITAFVGDQQIEVEAGSDAALPKGLSHGLKVRGDPARLW